MEQNQTILIQITPSQLDEIIEQNVTKAVTKMAKLPKYVSAEVLAQHFQVAKDKTISPSTLRKWPILRPYRRKIHGKVLFKADGVFDAIERKKVHQGITIKTIT